MALRRHFPVLRRHAGQNLVACAAVVLSIAGAAAVIADQLAPSSRPASLAPSGTFAATRTLVPSAVEGRMVATGDDWIEQVKSKEFWAKISRQGSGSSSKPRAQEPPSRAGGPVPGLVNVAVGKSGEADAPRRSVVDDDDDDGNGNGGSGTWKGSGGNTYRTVCVRLCDGFYTPLSFSTTRDKLERDAERCESSCGGQARMFYYRASDSQVEDMEDIDGKPYRKLPTAFLYRTSYNAQCTCRPQPWSQEALDRHKLYALQEAGNKGDKAARKQADDIVARQKKADADAAAERNAAEKAARKQKSADARSSTKSNRSAAAASKGDSPAGHELVGAGMTVPAARQATDRPMSRKDRQARSVAPPQKPKLWASMPEPIPSKLEVSAAHLPRLRSADVSRSRVSHDGATLVSN